MGRGAFLGLLLAAAWVGSPSPAPAQEEPEVPFVPTPMEVVHSILEMAGTTSADTVYDLGSGDGRIPLVAARDYGAVGVGVELDSALVALSRRRAREAGLEDRVRYVRGDLFDVELRPATVLVLYLNTLFNLRLRPRILDEMDAGTRVVSHVFDMGQWPADSVARKLQFGAFLYLWTVPADVEGRWRFVLDSGAEVELELDQKFQTVCARRPRDGSGVAVEEGVLEGDRVRMTLKGMPEDGGPLELTGRVDGAAMEGRIVGGGQWSATRLGAGDGSLERWQDAPDDARLPPGVCPGAGSSVEPVGR